MTGNILWINNLTGGVNQNVSPTLIKNSQFKLLNNVTQEFLGTLSHRLGSTLYLDSVDASNPVRGLHMYEKDTGVDYLHMVVDGDLYVNGATTWTSQATSEWATDSEIDMANYINRHYMASSTADENLRYATETGATTTVVALSTTISNSSTGSTLVVNDNIFTSAMVGTTVTNTTDGQTRTITGYTNATTVTVDSAINDTWDGDDLEIYVDGKYLAVNGAYLMIAGNSTFPRRTYYSNVESDTFNLGSDYFITSLPPTGVASFGNGRAFIIFTKNNYLVVDPATTYTNQVDDYGCSSHRSIQNIRGRLVWFDRDAFYMLSANQAYPTEISVPLRNKTTGDAVIDKINASNFEVVASGQEDSRYFCALRDLTGNVLGETLDACVVEIDLQQSTWKVHTYDSNDIGSVFASFRDSTGDEALYSGSFSNGTVYKLNVPSVYTDDDTTDTTNTVTSTIITKDYGFNKGRTAEVTLTKVDNLHFKYFAESAISVSFALDGTDTYTSLSTLDAHTSTKWKFAKMPFGKDECKTISLKMTCNGDFKIFGIGFEVKDRGITGLKGV